MAFSNKIVLALVALMFVAFVCAAPSSNARVESAIPIYGFAKGFPPVSPLHRQRRSAEDVQVVTTESDNAAHNKTANETVVVAHQEHPAESEPEQIIIRKAEEHEEKNVEHQPDNTIAEQTEVHEEILEKQIEEEVKPEEVKPEEAPKSFTLLRSFKL